MRWPWFERSAVVVPTGQPLNLFRCNECVIDPARIRQLLQGVVQEGSALTLFGRGMTPVHAKTRANATAHHLSLQFYSMDSRLTNPVTTVARLAGVEVVFSSNLTETSEGDWIVGIPDELLYLNMRACFRSIAMLEETVWLREAGGHGFGGKLINLSEEGSCISINPADAEQLRRQPHGWHCELRLKDGNLAAGLVRVCHLDASHESARLGVSFQLPEGEARKHLRQTLYRRQVNAIQ